MDLRETETKHDAPADAALPGLEQLPQVAAVHGPEEQRLEAETVTPRAAGATRAPGPGRFAASPSRPTDRPPGRPRVAAQPACES